MSYNDHGWNPRLALSVPETQVNNINPTTPSLDGLRGGNSAVAAGVGEIGGAVTDVAATATGAMFQRAENEAARRESREWADTQRQDNLEQQDVDNRYRKRMFEQEQQAFALKQKKEQFDMRHRRWLDMFKKQLEADSHLQDDINNWNQTVRRNRERENISRNTIR